MPGFGEIGAVAQRFPLRFLGRQCCASALRDERPLLLGEGREEMQDERVSVSAKLGDDERLKRSAG